VHPPAIEPELLKFPTGQVVAFPAMVAGFDGDEPMIAPSPAKMNFETLTFTLPKQHV
jgi:hypothetical protein